MEVVWILGILGNLMINTHDGHIMYDMKDL